MTTSHPHFVPSGESRTETAILLTGTAREYDLGQASVKTDSRNGGFWISDDLKAVLEDEMSEEFGLLNVSSPGEVSGNQVEVLASSDAPEPQRDEDEDTYDPADDTVDEVKAYVTENPEYAEIVLALEQTGKNRSSLISWLAEQSA